MPHHLERGGEEGGRERAEREGGSRERGEREREREWENGGREKNMKYKVFHQTDG